MLLEATTAFPSLPVTVSLLGVVGWLAYLALSHRRKRLPTEPPYVPGHFVWGSAKEFNSNAVEFLHQCEKEHGDIFTIRLAHQYMTIVADPHSAKEFGKEPNFEFNPIQEQVNSNIFGFSIPDSKKMLTAVGKTTKGTAIPKTIASYSGQLAEAFSSLREQNSVQDQSHTIGLRALASKTVFAAIFNNIYGADKITEDFNSQKFSKNFHIFHQYFNHLWLGLPHCLFPEAGSAAVELMKQPSSEELLKSEHTSDYLKAAAEYMLESGKSDRDIKAHNLVYLHVNFNTFKVSFWCAYYLLTHPEALAALREEIDTVIDTKQSADSSETDTEDREGVEMTIPELDSMQVLDSVVNESFRMSSGVFMIRQVTQDTDFTMNNGKTYTVRGGDKVAVYPPACHKDPTIFEDPLTFKYDRFIGKKFYKNGIELRSPLMPFGTLCPGRKTAILQIKWFLVSLLNELDLSLNPGEETSLDVQYHGHEIIPPVKDVDITYTEREQRTPISLQTSL